ncbi:MAG: NAD(P)/FAD-dependent oxidoreductase [Coriobacteriales bacterium]|jgi:2,4-dienoyl-CoA reductase-like NADH-dependent reductase (Old Yellow Enzyme family)/thioredoxin reductase|nr:NAD(P)/FAD-dependent oxidoreductase [Coriobacteriales bacterium]
MQRKYPHLAEPLAVGRALLKNRMVSAPLGATDITADGSPGPRTSGFYELRAKGGAAAVTASELTVHPATDGSQMLHLSLKNPGQLAAFTFLADAINRHGALASVELSHSGQYAGTYMVDKKSKGELHQWGPSDWTRPDGMPVKALAVEQLQDIVKAYAEAASLAKRAGFRMVMVHAGHTWLLNQFLSPFFNHRKDRYGGSLENRARLAVEVLQAVREAVGPGFPIECRISGSEFFEGGYDLDDGVRIAQIFQDYCDILHVSAGSYQYGFSITHPSQFRPHGCNVFLAEEIKRHLRIPVATVGGLSDPDQMEEIVASGKADIVVMGRGLLADPYIPRKVLAGHGDDVNKCLRCFVCMAERPATQTRRCAINPLIGREIEGTEIEPAPVKRKVLVVGGGIAGLVAACTAAKRGHQVTLAEKGGALGGILLAEQALPFKREMYELTQTYARRAARLGVEVLLDTEVDAAWAEGRDFDAAILALGSAALGSPLKLTDSSTTPTAAHVHDLEDYYLHGGELADEVIVLGAGLSGVECAIGLAEQGKTVHLVGADPELCPDANIRQRPILLDKLSELKIDAQVGLFGQSYDGQTLRASEAGDPAAWHEFKGGDVVLAVGRKARADAAKALLEIAPLTRMVGDCLRPANVTTAVYEAYHAALDL